MPKRRPEIRQTVLETAQTIPERSRGGPKPPRRALEISQKSPEIRQTLPEMRQMTPETRWGIPELLQREAETGWKALEMKQTVCFRNLFAPIPLLPSVKSECSTKLSLWPPSDWLKCAAENRFGHAAQKRTAIHPCVWLMEMRGAIHETPCQSRWNSFFSEATPQNPCGMAPPLLERRANAKVRCLGDDRT